MPLCLAYGTYETQWTRYVCVQDRYICDSESGSLECIRMKWDSGLNPEVTLWMMLDRCWLVRIPLIEHSITHRCTIHAECDEAWRAWTHIRRQCDLNLVVWEEQLIRVQMIRSCDKLSPNMFPQPVWIHLHSNAVCLCSCSVCQCRWYDCRCCVNDVNGWIGWTCAARRNSKL